MGFNPQEYILFPGIMNGELKTARSNSLWLVTAADLIYKIRVRWKLTSDLSFSQKLHINPRTVAKLNRFHPDSSLKFETVMGIFRSLLLIIPFQEWSESRNTEEYRMIHDDMMAVVNARIPVPKGIREDIADAIEKEQYLSGNDIT